MLSHFSDLDLIALGWLAAAWGVHGIVVDRCWLPWRSLNARMHEIRRSWMRNLLHRENRIMDSQLLGHLMTSVSFFASTTVLMLAGILGALASAETAHGVVAELGFTTVTSQTQFELKVLIIGAIFVYAFFAFTWSIRQFNYALALMGALPNAHSQEADILADETATVLSRAVGAFNGGLRCYYFAFAALGWSVNAWTFMVLVALVTLVLLLRQFGSVSAQAVQRYAARTRSPKP